MGFIWIGALVVFILAELATMGLTTIWFAGGALVAFLVSLVTDSVIVQCAAFAIVSVALLILTRPLAEKYINGKTTKTNSESLPGKVGLVKEAIDNLHGTGCVVIDGLEWTARTENPDERIEVGTRVNVVRIEGVKLIVTAVQTENGSEIKEV